MIFDGVDTQVWRPQPDIPRRLGNLSVPDGVRIVTYATRGMESMRGFDIFMKMAKRLCDRRRPGGRRWGRPGLKLPGRSAKISGER